MGANASSPEEAAVPPRKAVERRLFVALATALGTLAGLALGAAAYVALESPVFVGAAPLPADPPQPALALAASPRVESLASQEPAALATPDDRQSVSDSALAAAGRLPQSGSSPRSFALVPAQLDAFQAGTASPDAAADRRVTSFVLLGLDKTSTLAGNTDVIMLVSVDPTAQQIVLLSIPRDLCAYDCQSWSDRINYIYYSKGPMVLLDTIHELTNIDVEHYVAINFDGFAKIIDALGGVRVNVDRDFSEQFGFPDGSTDHLELSSGPNQLTGRQALMYARSRKFDAAGDFARICRQQQILKSLKDQVLSARTILAVPAILGDLRSSLATDFTLRELVSLLRTASGIRAEDVHSRVISNDGVLASPTRGSDGAYLIRPDAKAIQDFAGGSLGGAPPAAPAAESLSSRTCA